LPSNTKFQTDQSETQRQTVYRLNQIKIDLEKQKNKERREETNKAERRLQEDDVMEKYRKLSANDVIKNHD